MEDGIIYLPHGLRLDLENEAVEYELWLVENGWQTTEQADEHIIYWKEHHREIQP